MKILGLLGSPRQGNTALLLSRLLEGASSCGANTISYDLTRLDIKPCTHCDACLENGQCNIDDDMQVLYRELESADVVVLASPLHFMSVTAQTKGFIDRCQSIWVRKYILGREPLGSGRQRKGIFISVGGREGKRLFDSARVTVKALFASLDVDYTGELLFAGIDEAGDITNHPSALDEAFQTGVCLAESQS
ncbi:MAG: NAD(P)H-dependent oxidoreductase [Dehalococcoidales bacterium]|jgi:multimeric flavodoxin WrbA|nr:NAD(P)H-dependent oxidoreductase [Dehalococcoidales bacterium]MDD3264509.1 NAD(P)H-dependent oxidoreductase [Dehalococcoidales bacterium]MDD4322184.1 NAD(P)H-dependent oxidoreductase [Dehalococcoidales bacterium]MDD4794191.1 NAD(P)H-dependent oxidoreductase [Dehalococcoidales bacterium]MDD5498445.1 NAD(P)H-dependent oxidoreductase [Dehalococcoidales bacterium]